MQLTKVKRRELKRGDMFCAQYEKAVSEVYMVTADGDNVIDSISNMEVYRIDAPDYTHELTQFSWKLKQLDDIVWAWDNIAPHIIGLTAPHSHDDILEFGRKVAEDLRVRTTHTADRLETRRQISKVGCEFMESLIDANLMNLAGELMLRNEDYVLNHSGEQETYRTLNIMETGFTVNQKQMLERLRDQLQQREIQMPKVYLDNKEIKDRFEVDGNICDSCKWIDEVSDSEFPCLYCIHNENHKR